MKKEGKIKHDYEGALQVAVPAVARSIARRLGGDILLDTAYTAGTWFVMTLPIDKQMD